MRKLLLVLIIGGGLYKPLINTSPLGSGGSAEDPFQIPKNKMVQINQNTSSYNQSISYNQPINQDPLAQPNKQDFIVQPSKQETQPSRQNPVVQSNKQDIQPSKHISLIQPNRQEVQLNRREVDQIIAVELSKDAALKELLDVRTVEMAKPDIWPVVGIVTSDYGWRVFRGQREFHTGIDIAAPYGTPVSVTSDGKVIYVGWINGYGKTVIVYHGHGFVTLYGHLSEYAVNYGDKVVKGQVVGFVGMTGRTSGPHLHYEVIKYGNRQNPIAYLP